MDAFQRLKLKKKSKKPGNNNPGSTKTSDIIVINDSPEKNLPFQNQSKQQNVNVNDEQGAAIFSNLKQSITEFKASRNSSTVAFSNAKDVSKRIRSSLISKALQKTNGYQPLPVVSRKDNDSSDTSYKELPKLCKKCLSLSFPQPINWNFTELFPKDSVDTKPSNESKNHTTLTKLEKHEKTAEDFNAHNNEINLTKGRTCNENSLIAEDYEDISYDNPFSASIKNYSSAKCAKLSSFGNMSARETCYDNKVNSHLTTDALREKKGIKDQLKLNKTDNCSSDMENAESNFNIDLTDFDAEMDDFLLDISDENVEHCNDFSFQSSKSSSINDCIRKELGRQGTGKSSNEIQTSVNKDKTSRSDSMTNNGLPYSQKAPQNIQSKSKAQCNISFLTKERQVPIKGKNYFKSDNIIKDKEEKWKNRLNEGNEHLKNHSFSFKHNRLPSENVKNYVGNQNIAQNRLKNLKRKYDVVNLDDDKMLTSNNSSSYMPSNKSIKLHSTIKKCQNSIKAASNSSPEYFSNQSKPSYSLTNVPDSANKDASNSSFVTCSSRMSMNCQSTSSEATAPILLLCPVCKWRFPDGWRESQRNQHATQCSLDSIYIDDADDELFGQIDLDF